jgi:molybdate transport system regulatory protein
LSTAVSFMARSNIDDFRLSIRLDFAAGVRIGPGKIALLEAIREKGSISGAARKMGMAYRKAWLLVEQMNQLLGQPVVTTVIGGAEGGGTELTKTGKRLIGLYYAIASSAQTAADTEAQLVKKSMLRGAEN